MDIFPDHYTPLLPFQGVLDNTTIFDLEKVEFADHPERFCHKCFQKLGEGDPPKKIGYGMPLCRGCIRDIEYMQDKAYRRII